MRTCLHTHQRLVFNAHGERAGAQHLTKYGATSLKSPLTLIRRQSQGVGDIYI